MAPGKSWIAPNNEKLVALPAQFPNVKVLYWDGLAAQCPGACFYGDGIHLAQAGQDYYTAADHEPGDPVDPIRVFDAIGVSGDRQVRA